MIPSIFCVLSLLFTVLLTCRTNTLLKTIQPQHFQNLPSKNALTFLDTQILFVSIIVQFFVIGFISILSYFLGISHDQFIFLKVILHFFIDNVFICFIFPIYIGYVMLSRQASNNCNQFSPLNHNQTIQTLGKWLKILKETQKLTSCLPH